MNVLVRDLDPQVVKDLGHLAVEQGISRNELIVHALTEHAKRWAKKQEWSVYSRELTADEAEHVRRALTEAKYDIYSVEDACISGTTAIEIVEQLLGEYSNFDNRSRLTQLIVDAAGWIPNPAT